MQQFFIYILKCNDGSYFVGHTDNLEATVNHHKSGIGHAYTISRLPVQLVYTHPFNTRNEAFSAEMQMKKWTRDKKEALVRGDFQLLSQLSKKKITVQSAVDQNIKAGVARFRN
jgi:predicted GIY-YIG superfamily endonuclease